MSNIREKFEAWAKSEFIVGVIGFGMTDNGEYLDRYTNFLWRGYQQAHEDQQARIDEQAKEIESLKYRARRDNQTIHDMITGNQAAYIEAEKNGAEKGMEWISNGLWGPNFIPKITDQTAQQFYDANCYDAVMKALKERTE